MEPITAAIAAGSQLLTGGIDAYVSNQNNKRTIAANKELAEYAFNRNVDMMNKQNAYNREMWNMQNEYNAPTAQMARLKAAGLNPALVYGTGAVANNASAPASSELARYNAPTVRYERKPLVNPGAALGAYQDMQMRSAQIDNVRASTEAIRAKTISETFEQTLFGYKASESESKAETSRIGVDLARLRREAEAYGPRQAELKNALLMQTLSNLKVDEANKLLDQEYKKANLTTQQIQQENLRYDALYKKYQAVLQQAGISNSDPVYWRLGIRLLEKAGIDLFTETPDGKK